MTQTITRADSGEQAAAPLDGQWSPRVNARDARAPRGACRRYRTYRHDAYQSAVHRGRAG